MNLLLLIKQSMATQQPVGQQATQQPVGQQVIQLLPAVLNAPRKAIQRVQLDLAPVCSAVAFAAEIEDAQDPVTPLYVPRMEPPKLNKRR
jgi:hypothetical protein